MHASIRSRSRHLPMLFAAYLFCIPALFAGAPDPAHYTSAWTWTDGAALPIEGRAFADEPYVRIPARFKGKVPADVFNYAQQSTGLFLRFRTDSDALAIHWKIHPFVCSDPMITPMGMQSVSLWREGAEGWEMVTAAHPRADGDNEICVGWTPGAAGIVYLPMRSVVQKFEMGVKAGKKILPFPHVRGPQKPIVVYGTSIVHGGCVSQPGNMFTAFMGRELDANVIALGFSGAGRMESEMADFLAQIDAALYVVDCDWNMDEKMQSERCEPFLRRLHAARPDVPILLCGGCTESKKPLARERIPHQVYDKLKAEDAAKWKDLHFMSGVEALPKCSWATHDHCHPNDFGSPYMGHAYARKIAAILGLK